MPRKNSTAWAVGNPVTSMRLNHLNSDIDDLYALGSDRMGLYRISTDPSLQVRIGSGAFRVGGTEGIYAGGTLTVADNTTTYVMVDTAGTIQTSTSGWNTNHARLGRVIASSGVVTIIRDRVDAIGGVLGGLTFTDTRAVATIPDDYNDFTFKAQFKQVSAVGLSGIAMGTYCRLLGGRGWSDSSGGLAFEVAYCDNGVFQRRGSSTTWGKWYKNLEESENISYFEHLIYNA